MWERGPIRPPSEAGSLLFRFTRNCPWNRCTFCGVYKGKRFALRPLSEILSDIDAAARMLEEGGPPGLPRFAHPPALFRASGCATAFLQDADSLLMPTRDLTAALSHLRARIPGLARVTTYARSATIARKSPEDLRAIREAGCDRLHIGVESGSDTVLAAVKKGTDAARHIAAGRMAREAGFEVSAYVMPGLGGRERSREHAVETARCLAAMNPHFVRLRTLRVLPGTPLADDTASGRFTEPDDDLMAREIRLMLETMGEECTATVVSDHFSNLLEDLGGPLPEARNAMIATLDRYLSLPDDERQLFRLGRRGGALRGLSDFEDPALRRRLEAARRDLAAESGDDIEAVIRELSRQTL